MKTIMTKLMKPLSLRIALAIGLGWAVVASAAAMQSAPRADGGPARPSLPPLNAPAMPPPADYQIANADVLNILVRDSPELSQKFTVQSDGTIFLPLLGRFPVAGQTAAQVEKA